MAALERFVTAYQVTVHRAPHAPAAPAAPHASAPNGSDDPIAQSIQDANQAISDASGKNTVIRIGRDGPIITQSDGPLPASTVAQFDTTHLIPPQAVDIAIGFFVMCAVMVVGWPLARAFGRRIERGGAMPAAPTAAMAEQLQRIEQAVEAMSIEVERISESQRFMARIQSQGAADPMVLPSQRG